MAHLEQDITQHITNSKTTQIIDMHQKDHSYDSITTASFAPMDLVVAKVPPIQIEVMLDEQRQWILDIVKADIKSQAILDEISGDLDTPVRQHQKLLYENQTLKSFAMLSR